MKRNEFNTNQFSLERIYKYDIFLTYYFDHNNPENNIIGIPKFLSNAALEAINEKYEDWNIKPSYDEGDYSYLSENMFHHNRICHRVQGRVYDSPLFSGLE